MPPCTNTLPVASSGGPSEAAPVPKVHLSLGRRDGCGGEGNSWETGLSTLGSLKKRPALCSWGRDRKRGRQTDKSLTGRCTVTRLPSLAALHAPPPPRPRPGPGVRTAPLQTPRGGSLRVWVALPAVCPFCSAALSAQHFCSTVPRWRGVMKPYELVMP